MTTTPDTPTAPPATCPVRDFVLIGPTEPAGSAFARMDAHRAAARPVLRTEEAGGYYVFTDHDAVVDGLRDWELWDSTLVMPTEPHPQYRMVPVMLDGDEHKRWRRLLATWFTPARARGMLDEHHRMAARIVDTVAGRGECEILSEVTRVFPALVFMQVMGMPEDRLPDLLYWVDKMVHFDAERDHQDERFAAMNQVFAYFTELIAARRAHPDPLARDLVSHAVSWEIDGHTISDEDLLNCMNVLIGAGLDTVSATAGYGLLHLAERPELRRRLAAAPHLWPAAVEEIVRIHPVAQLTRRATRDAEFHGCPIREGDIAMFPPAAAGRDERVYPNPLEIDLERSGPAQPGFGAGPHFCAGVHFARQQLAVLMEQWHRRVPDYEVVGTPPESSGGIWGLRELRLRWDV